MAGQRGLGPSCQGRAEETELTMTCDSRRSVGGKGRGAPPAYLHPCQLVHLCKPCQITAVPVPSPMTCHPQKPAGGPSKVYLKPRALPHGHMPALVQAPAPAVLQSGSFLQASYSLFCRRGLVTLSHHMTPRSWVTHQRPLRHSGPKHTSNPDPASPALPSPPSGLLPLLLLRPLRLLPSSRPSATSP